MPHNMEEPRPSEGEPKSSAPPKRITGKKPRPNTTSSFHGVRRRSWGRYVSEIRLPGGKTRVWLGSFVSAEMAARAYDSAAFYLKGSSAILNFPDSVNLLPRPESCSVRDIQMTAAKAAAIVTIPDKTCPDIQHNCGSSAEPPPASESSSSAWLDSADVYYDIAEVSLEEASLGPMFSPLKLESEVDSWDQLLRSYENADDYHLASSFHHL